LRAGIDCHAAVDRGAVEVQQHGPGFRLHDGHRDVVPGEGADRRGGCPERVRGQLDSAVPVQVAAQQVGALETGQPAQLGQQRAGEVPAVVSGAVGVGVADQVLTVSSLASVMRVIVARRDIKVKVNYLPISESRASG
jgi:hypothetical protein